MDQMEAILAEGTRGPFQAERFARAQLALAELRETLGPVVDELKPVRQTELPLGSIVPYLPIQESGGLFAQLQIDEMGTQIVSDPGNSMSCAAHKKTQDIQSISRAAKTDLSALARLTELALAGCKTAVKALEGYDFAPIIQKASTDRLAVTILMNFAMSRLVQTDWNRLCSILKSSDVKRTVLPLDIQPYIDRAGTDTNAVRVLVVLGRAGHIRAQYVLKTLDISTLAKNQNWPLLAVLRGAGNAAAKKVLAKPDLTEPAKEILKSLKGRIATAEGPDELSTLLRENGVPEIADQVARYLQSEGWFNDIPLEGGLSVKVRGLVLHWHLELGGWFEDISRKGDFSIKAQEIVAQENFVRMRQRYLPLLSEGVAMQILRSLAVAVQNASSARMLIDAVNMSMVPGVSSIVRPMSLILSKRNKVSLMDIPEDFGIRERVLQFLPMKDRYQAYLAVGHLAATGNSEAQKFLMNLPNAEDVIRLVEEKSEAGDISAIKFWHQWSQLSPEVDFYFQAWLETRSDDQMDELNQQGIYRHHT